MDPQNPNSNISALVDPHAYARKRQMIQEARMYIDQAEAQNEAGFQAFAYTEQELQRRIREGREAEMAAAQLRTGGFSQQSFVAQQPQTTAWQTSFMPLPSVQQNFLPTSARIEEVPSVASGRTSRLGPTLQPYQQHAIRGGFPAQAATFVAHDFRHGQPPKQQSYYTTVHTPTVPAHQPPPHQEPVASTPSPTSPHPLSAHHVSPPQSSTEKIQPAAQADYVIRLIDFLQKYSPHVQRKVLTQILEYIGGQSTPSPQIRMWGDKLKRVGNSDPKELLNVVITRLKTRQAQTSQSQSQTQAGPQLQLIPESLPVTQSQFQAAHSEELPQSKVTAGIEQVANGVPPLPPAEQQILNKVLGIYSRELRFAKIDQRRVADIISVAYISARLKQPPNDADVWVQKTLDIFEAHFPIERVPEILKFLLQNLRRPIPNIPASTEPRTMSHSSNSLAGALVDTPSNGTPLVVTHQSPVVAQPLGNGATVEIGVSDSLPEVETLHSRDHELSTISRTQATGNVLHISTQPSSPSSVILTNAPYPTTAVYNTSTVLPNAVHQGFQPMDYSQLALVPRSDFSNAAPILVQEERQPTASGFEQYRQPEASTLTPLQQPPVKVRLPKAADRSRLAKDILKQLGKPTGSVPVIPTRREYKKRKEAQANTEGTTVHPSTEPVVEPQLVLNRDNVPLPLDPVPARVAPGPLSTNPFQENLANQSPPIGYPDQHDESAPPDTDAIGQDVDMDIQPPGDPSVPQPSGSSGPVHPQYSTYPSMDLKSAQNKEGGSAAENPPPSEPLSSRCIGPPPDAEVIEISDDEGQPTVSAVMTTADPMEVDGEIGMGRTISKSLSQMSLDGDGTTVAVEMEKDHTEEPLDPRSSQEPVIFKDTHFAEKKSQKVQPYVEVPPLPDYVRKSKDKERTPVEAADEEDPELQAVVNLAFSRLRPIRCLWLGCRATLNSANNLIKHLKIHADETERSSDNLGCRWKKCTRSYRTRVKLDRHCVHHAQKVLHCPYEDCGEEFRDAGELLDHIKDMHEDSDLLPSTSPVPYTGRTLDPLPEQVPSWTIFPASVAPVPISADRHSQIGRWVARNICGTTKRAGSSSRLRSSWRSGTGKQKPTGLGMEEMMNEERFGFISSTDDGNTMFTNIPSEAVSLSCRYGQLPLSEDDGHLKDNGRERSVIESSDFEDGSVRADTSVGEDVIGLELKPASLD